MRKYAYGIIFSIILTLFTIYISLDTFVIQRVYSNNIKSSSEKNIGEIYAQDEKEIQDTQEEKTTDEEIEKVVTDTSYQDENININLQQYNYENTVIYVADIKLSNAQYLKTALAQNSYGRNITQKTSETAQLNSAILAINGDYYGAQEKGYVIKNGVLYRDTPKENQEDLAIYADGSFEIVRENEVSASELIDKGVVNLLAFGPALVEDGQISVSTEDEVGKAMASNPRTAIGKIDDNHFVFIVADGRTSQSEGLSLYELANFATTLGADTVYNLDGGGSSTMYFNGNIINNPTTSGKSIKERSVSDIVYIGY